MRRVASLLGPLLAASLGFLTACSDTGSDDSNDGGAAGEGGSASGTGGSSGSATGGSAGSPEGGSAGNGAGSGGTGGTGPLCGNKTGGAFIDFEIVEETFRVWIESAAFISEAERLLDAQETRIPAFQTLVDGTGCDPQWSWHPDPNDAEFADFTIELCDALPSHIEENKAEWFDSVGSWCPWSARVTAVTAR